MDLTTNQWLIGIGVIVLLFVIILAKIQIDNYRYRLIVDAFTGGYGRPRQPRNPSTGMGGFLTLLIFMLVLLFLFGAIYLGDWYNKKDKNSKDDVNTWSEELENDERNEEKQEKEPLEYYKSFEKKEAASVTSKRINVSPQWDSSILVSEKIRSGNEETLRKDTVSEDTFLYVQVSAAPTEERGMRAVEKLEKKFPGKVHLGHTPDTGGLSYKILIGPFSSKQEGIRFTKIQEPYIRDLSSEPIEILY